MVKIQRFTVDGTDEYGFLDTDAKCPPFYVFEHASQTWVAGPFASTRLAKLSWIYHERVPPVIPV